MNGTNSKGTGPKSTTSEFSTSENATTKGTIKNGTVAKSTNDTQSESPAEAEFHTSIEFITSTFFSNLDVAYETFETIAPIIREQDRRDRAHFTEIVQRAKRLAANLRKAKRASTRTRTVTDILECAKQLMELTDKGNRLSGFYLPSLLLFLVAESDSLTYSVIRTALKYSPQHAHSESHLKFSEILNAASIEDLKEQIIETKVEGILRGDREHQLSEIDKCFKIGLREYFDKRPEFFEIFLRRNLIAHTGGAISSIFLAKIKKIGIPDEGMIVNRTISVTEDYISAAIRVLFDYGLRLSYGIVRRLVSREVAESSITEMGVRLLKQERWERAAQVFDFGLELGQKNISNDSTYRIFLVNRAISYAELGKLSEAKVLLNRADWSSCHPRFLIAKAALVQDYKQAAELMKRYGAGPISKEDYQKWPVFRQFRQTEHFLTAYRRIFRTSYAPLLPILPVESE